MDGSTLAPGANAFTTARAKYLRVSIMSGLKGTVPSGFAAKSRIQSCALPTRSIAALAQASDLSRSLHLKLAARNEGAPGSSTGNGAGPDPGSPSCGRAEPVAPPAAFAVAP